MNSRQTAILRAISAHTGPVSLQGLLDSIVDVGSRRTLQRELGNLCQSGLLERIGQTRATAYALTDQGRDTLREQRARYHPIDTSPIEESALVREDPEDTYQATPASERLALRDQVRRPQQKRKPVGYRREFLDAYEPNATPYLPEKLCQELYAIGQSEHMAAMEPGTYVRQVLDRLLIDLAWNSSRLEGNTYSLLETDHLLKLGKLGDIDRVREAQMILNHKAAIEFLVEAPMELDYNNYTLFNLHAILTEGLLTNAASEGKLRAIPVGISGTVYQPVKTPAVIEECFRIILQKVAMIKEPLEQCFFLMVHLPYLQPFEDGNKRSSRLIANLPLIQNNLSPLSFIDMPTRDYVDGILAVYELNHVGLLRDVFANAYEHSASRYASIRHEIGEPNPLWLQYRTDIKEQVRDVVVRQLGKLAAADHLRQWARQEVTASDRDKVVELIEEQLLLLNEGNIARMRLRPSEYTAWRPNWQK